MAEYIVKSGDSISKILKNMGVSTYGSKSSWQSVASASGISNYNLIYPNQKLIIPDSLLGITSAAPAPAPVTTAPTPAPAPSTSAEMKDYLNDYQDKLNTLENYDPFEEIGTIDDVMDELGVEGEMPVAPNYSEMFQTLRQNYNLDDIETAINETKNAIRQEQLLMDQQRNYERGKTTRLGVIEGRIDKATQDRMEAIQFYQNQASFLTDQANSAYGVIEMEMQFKQMDFETAKDIYQTEFQNRLAIYDSIISQAQTERSFQYQMITDQQKIASTNLSMYVDLIQSGSMKWSDMGKEQQTLIHKMEVQSGLPLGFVSTVKMPAGSNIKQILQRTDPYGNVYADILYIAEDGSLQVESKLTGKTKVASSGGGSSTTKAPTEKDLRGSMYSKLSSVATNGKVSTTTWNNYRSAWQKEGLDGVDFDEYFADFKPVTAKTTTTSSSSSSSVTSSSSSKNIFQKAWDWVKGLF